MGSSKSVSQCTCVFLFTLWNNVELSIENKFTANYSCSFLTNVPKGIPMQTKVLDLSQNNIYEVHISDFSPLPELQVLNLSHNLISKLDFSAFKFNNDLQYLDLSHNNMSIIKCQFMEELRHLDLSFNKFNALPICQELGIMFQLKYLGLSGTMIRRSDFRAIAHLQLNTVFLTLEDLTDYDSGSLPDLSTRNLHIVFPTNKDFNFSLLYDGMSTSEKLEFFNIKYDLSYKDFRFPPLSLEKEFKTSNLILNNVDLSWTIILRIFMIVWYSHVESFTVKNLTFGGEIRLNKPDISSILKYQEQYFVSESLVKVVTLEHVRNKLFYFNQEIVYLAFSKMNIENLTISDANMPYMLCPEESSLFQYFDFSYNDLTDEVFKNCSTLTHLETFILPRNKFEKLSKVSSMTSKMISLKHLDISRNLLYYDEDEKQCNWTETLVKLNLSSNKLTDAVFKCLPLHVQILDLQNNQISTIPKEITELQALSELNIAFNRLTDLPGCRHFSALEFLNIEMNQILTPSSDFFQSCQNIRELKAGLNPFKCSCELQDFINLAKQGPARLGGSPELYVCEYPEGWKGTQLKDFHLSKIACNTALLLVTVLIITVVLVALVSFLCIYFDAPWYLKMLWQWTQTRRRVWNRRIDELPSHLQFHAFISYSEHDSLWVKNDLIPNLEREEGSIQLCVHERNFIPGKSIVENIINCIEKSYKSIFVLSPNFVQSEWCHYELYFAHHKLFSESSNSLILILLDPIPQYIIPARYHKLKALMAKRTYLEWPKEKNKHGLFWANLRAAININLPLSAKTNKV
ncbi:toll-like receptor 1 [Alligator mississippiensis]|uniref:toll-like receptor 1 n=1 Tax=Alligator mississippiensis TaxID=8496 RepID=UPI002877B734|nr:toll-like receptor 1 [Alligator mississippiensis]